MPPSKPAKRPRSASVEAWPTWRSLTTVALPPATRSLRDDDGAGRRHRDAGTQTERRAPGHGDERAIRAADEREARLGGARAAAALDLPHAVGAVAHLRRLGAHLRPGLNAAARWTRRAATAPPRPAVTTIPAWASRATTTPSTVSAEAAAGKAARRAMAAITMRVMPVLSARNR